MLAIAKSILDDAAIPYLVKGEHLHGLGHVLGAAQVQVKLIDESKARELLADVRPSEDDPFISW